MSRPSADDVLRSLEVLGFELVPWQLGVLRAWLSCTCGALTRPAGRRRTPIHTAPCPLAIDTAVKL